MDKTAIKQTMLALEEDALAHAREHYEEYLAEARLDRTEPIERDEHAAAETASELAEAFDQPVHTHAAKLAALQEIDFGPKSTVEEGAVVTLGGRHFVIAVSTTRFMCEGEQFMGISTQALIYKAMEGKEAGDEVAFNGRTLTLEEVY